MAAVSKAFAERARKLYPQESSLHAAITAGAGLSIHKCVDEIRKRDYIRFMGRLSERNELFNPTSALAKLRKLGAAKFQEWLEAHERFAELSDAWSDELSSNQELDEEIDNAPRESDDELEPFESER